MKSRTLLRFGTVEQLRAKVRQLEEKTGLGTEERKQLKTLKATIKHREKELATA